MPAASSLVKPRPSNLREWIALRRDHAGDAGGDQRIGARRRAAVVRARFERDISRCATRLFAGRSQGEAFGMRFASALMETFANDAIALRDHATDHRIGFGGVGAERSQFDGARHHGAVDAAEPVHDATCCGWIDITDTGVRLRSVRASHCQPWRR